MKRESGFLSCLCLLVVGSFAQDVQHAPTLQSCVADLNLWTSQIPGWPHSSMEQGREGTKSLTVREMVGRMSAMNDCVQSYPVFNKSNRDELSPAGSLLQIYALQIQDRLFNFLERHGMFDKFNEEDEAGKR
jgi:hypothetical protein